MTAHRFPTSLICLALLLGTAADSRAQARQSPQEAPRWYQVEIIIFAQRPPAGDPQEIWPRDVPLAYPPNWMALQDPAELAAAPAPADTAAATPAPPGAEAASPLPPEAPVDLAREPYLLLPEAERQLNPQARDLRRGSRYRVLFHQAWRQPMVALDKAPAILIDGGDSFGEHSELEGSITISIARYLHLHTNLWLSEFSANFGQGSGGWPELPQRPQRSSGPAPLLAGDSAEVDLWGYRQAPAGLYENILSRPHVVDRIVTFRQKRSRIRSGEVHYLDHPFLGLLVKMTPYEIPQPETQADLNAALPQP